MKSWEEEFQSELDRIERAHQPGKWSGDPREIEQAYDVLSGQLDERFKRQQRAFLEGYERREIDARSRETLENLNDHMKTLRPDQQWGSQQAMNQARAAAEKSVAEDKTFQAQKFEVAAELVDRYEVMLNRAQEHQNEVMERNGLSTQELEAVKSPVIEPAAEQDSEDPRRARAEKTLSAYGSPSMKPSDAPSPEHEHEP